MYVYVCVCWNSCGFSNDIHHPWQATEIVQEVVKSVKHTELLREQKVYILHLTLKFCDDIM